MSQPLLRKAHLFASAAALCLGAPLAPAAAQSDEDTATPTAEVIVVTGRKREETLQEAPIAVSAFTADTLVNVGAISARDIADLTPGLQINGDFGRSAERPVIRGISNLRSETPQPVGLFIDGVYVRSGVISSILDNVERVEVLKGPQGALYGRSTYGGVINYISKTPGDEFEGEIFASAAEHDQYELAGSVTVPVSDQFSFILGGRHYEYGGEYDNINADTDGARDVGSEETRAVYGLFNFKPIDRVEANVRAYSISDRDGQFAGQLFDSSFNNSVASGQGDACPEVQISYFCGEVSVPNEVNITTSLDEGDPIAVGNFPPIFSAQWDFRAGLDRDVLRVTGDVTIDITDTLTLTYLTGYTEEETRTVTNQSYSPVVVANPFGSFPAAWVTDIRLDREYLSNEVRLNGEAGPNLEWLAGVFLYHDESETVDRNILEADYAFGGATTNDEIALYGAADYRVTDNLAFGFEGRYYEEDVAVDVAADGLTGDDLTETFDGFTYRGTAEFTYFEDTLIYGSIATGNKAGGFNTGVDPNNPEEAQFSSFDEELATQYEIGAKTALLDGRLRVNGALYAIDLEDQQLSQVVTLGNDQVTVVLNVGETEIRGFEVDAAFDVTDRLTVLGGWALADSEITAGTDDTQGTIFGDDSLVGSDVPRVSENSGTLSAEYTFPELAGWTPYARADGIYASTRYAQVHNLQETGDSFRTNLRVSLQNENWGTRVDFFGRNVFDDDTAANVFRYVDPRDFQFFRRSHVVFLPRGQQFGVSVRKSF